MLGSCGSQVPIYKTSFYRFKLKKGTKIYPLSPDNLGTEAPIVLDKKMKGRILFRDANKSNVAEAHIFLGAPDSSGMPTSGTDYRKKRQIITMSKPYYLLPRNGFGKAVDFDAVAKFRTRYANIGVFFNPFQMYATFTAPRYFEPDFGKKSKIGFYYGISQVYHRYKELNYSRQTLTYGPYISLGQTNISDASLINLDDSLVEQYSQKPVFGMGAGIVVNYSLNDVLGIGLLVGHEQVFFDRKEEWIFNNNNLAIGLTFVFQFSRL